MNVFDQLAEIYFEIDSNYASVETDAHARGHLRKEVKFQKKRELNDQAYFLFMFTRLEDRVKKLSIKLIEEKYNDLTNWNYRRTWEILYQRRNKGIYFLDRVALLTKFGQADYLLIKNYYEQRNNIGHGGQSFTIPISIPTVVTNMKRLYHDLGPK
jgi:hypothetical protein